MAKMFLNVEESLQKLGCDEDALKQAVRDGKLREFRADGKINYKADEIEKLAASGDLKPSSPDTDLADLSASLGSLGLADTGDSMPGLSSTGSIGLADTDNPMPDLSSAGSIGLGDSGGLSLSGTALGGTAAGMTGPTELGIDSSEGSAINLAAEDTGDMLSLDDDEASSDRTATGKGKDDTVVSSVGVSVFDEEDLDESADPLAKTLMTGTAGGTGLEGIGSGSGLLDLTRESDDTSLGAELLDEIYPGDESGTLEMGDATRAGLEGAAEPAPSQDTPDALESPLPDEPEPVVEKKSAAAAPAAAIASGDVFVAGAAGLVAVAIIAMCFAGLAVAAMIRGVLPSMLDFVYAKLWMFGLGAVLVAGAAMGLGILLGRRSRSS